MSNILNTDGIDKEESQNATAADGAEQLQAVFAQDVRNTIIELLKKGTVSSFDNEKTFKILYLNKEKIADYLENINLKLIINQESSIAYVENYRRETADEDDESVSAETENANADNFLISSRKLSVFDTLILLILRKFYQERYTNGENTIVIDMDRIENMLTPFIGVVGSTKSTRKKIKGVLERLSDRKLLKFLTSEDNDRMVLSPLIRYVVDVDVLSKMLSEYMTLAQKHKIKLPADLTADDEDNDEDREN